MALLKAPPKEPYKQGKISQEFGGPATSALDVLMRARVAISPRGAWSSSGWTKSNPSGFGRCLLQLCRDVDGVHVKPAERFLSEAIKLEFPGRPTSVSRFNDSSQTRKHDAIRVLDTAIELARKEGK
jgi:hypothetical protein